jgi:hypothetical protein
VTGETGNLVTLRDEQIVDERKKAAVRLQDLLIDDRAGFGFTPETQALRASLKAYLEYLDTIEFKRRKKAGQPSDLVRLLVRQLATRWPEIDGERAKAWPDKKRKTICTDQPFDRPSKFSAVISSVCALCLELKPSEMPSNTTVRRWLNEDLPKGSP